MSYVGGFAQALSRRAAEDRASAEGDRVREETRKAAREDYMFKMGEQRKTELAKLLAERQASSPQPDADQLRDQMWLKKRIGGVEGGDDLLAAAMQDPFVASSIREKYEAAKKLANEEGRTGWDITGQQIVDGFSTYGIGAAPADLVDFGSLAAEIEGGNYSDSGSYVDMYGRVIRAGQGGSGAVYDVESNVDWLSEGNEQRFADQKDIFESNVVTAASQYRQSVMDEGGTEFAEVDEAIRNFGKEGFQDSTEALKRRFGGEAISGMIGTDLPFYANIDKNPYLAPYMPQAPAPQDEEVQPTPEVPASLEDTEVITESTASATVPEETSGVPQEIIDKVMDENVSYEEWQAMSRSEREEKGLPVTTIGGSWKYRNRDGGWSVFGIPDPDYRVEDTGDATAADIASYLVDNGEITEGEVIRMNGDDYTYDGQYFVNSEGQKFELK